MAEAPQEDAEPAVVTTRAAVDPEPQAGPQVSLVLSYSGDCWTEVTDASGSRLYFDLGRDGSDVRVSGTAPLRVLFGSYSNVALTVNGESYAIPPSSLRGDTARFTIPSP